MTHARGEILNSESQSRRPRGRPVDAGGAEMSFILYHESRSVRSCVYTCMCSLDSGVATAGRGEASCLRYGERGRKLEGPGAAKSLRRGLRVESVTDLTRQSRRTHPAGSVEPAATVRPTPAGRTVNREAWPCTPLGAVRMGAWASAMDPLTIRSRSQCQLFITSPCSRLPWGTATAAQSLAPAKSTCGVEVPSES